MNQTAEKGEKSITDVITEWKEKLEKQEANPKEILLQMDPIVDSAIAYPFDSLMEMFIFAEKNGFDFKNMLLAQINKILGVVDDADSEARESFVDPLPVLVTLRNQANQARARGEYKKADEIDLKIIEILNKEVERLNALLLHYSNL